MRNKIQRLPLIALLVAVLFLFMWGNVSAEAQDSVIENKRVLLLSSYSYSWGSVPLQIRGVSSELDDGYLLNYDSNFAHQKVD